MLKAYKQNYIAKCKKKIDDHFRLQLTEIPISNFVLGQMRYNHKCFFNSAHECAIHDFYTAHIVYCVDDEGFNFLHVINRDERTGKYVDHTLGISYSGNKYFYIKELPKTEIYGYGAYHFFHNYRVRLLAQFTSKRLCKWLGLSPEDLI